MDEHLSESAQDGLAEQLSPMELLLTLQQDQALDELFAPTAAGPAILSEQVGTLQLEGSAGADRFYFPESLAAQEVRVTGFAPEAGDQLDLRDLLVGETEATLDRYLEFTEVADQDGVSHTHLAISTQGDGRFDHGITLNQVDFGVPAADLLTHCLSNGYLLTD